MVASLVGGPSGVASAQPPLPPVTEAPIEAPPELPAPEAPAPDAPAEIPVLPPVTEGAGEAVPGEVAPTEVAPAANSGEEVPVAVAPVVVVPVVVVPVAAPTEGAPVEVAPAPAAPAPVAVAEARRPGARGWRHGGFILDLQLGTIGCTRRICHGASGHHAAPGAHLGAFVGANVLGVFELGIEGGWNSLRSRGVVGRNPMTLYGIDPAVIQQAIAAEQGVPASSLDFSTLEVSAVTSRALDVGPSLRFHVLRKGRGLAYVGAGMHYQLWRNRYATPSGDLRLDFHGMSVPLRVGGGAFIHRNVALIGELTYAITVYAITGIDHPDLSAVAPLSRIEGLAQGLGTSLSGGLPRFWTLSLTLRFRL